MKTVARYLSDSRLGSQQVERLREVLQPLEGIVAAKRAADEIVKIYTRRQTAQ